MKISREKPSVSSQKKLYEALLQLDNMADCEKFFTDLCTPAELQSLSDRWKVVKLLDQEIPYRKIHEKTGVSTATITRVARCLVYGRGGYRTILKKMKENGS